MHSLNHVSIKFNKEHWKSGHSQIPHTVHIQPTDDLQTITHETTCTLTYHLGRKCRADIETLLKTIHVQQKENANLYSTFSEPDNSILGREISLQVAFYMI